MLDGVELDSREEAEEAQKELERIQIILDETNLWDIVDLAIAQVRLRPFKTAVGEKYRNKISKLYKIVDHYERMVDGEEVDMLPWILTVIPANGQTVWMLSIARRCSCCPTILPLFASCRFPLLLL